MEEKKEYSKPIAQVVYFDDEDIVAATVNCWNFDNHVYHEYCTANDCLVRNWMGGK